MISELLKLFKATAARFGFPEWLVNEIVFYLVLVGFVFFVLQQLYKLLKWFFLWNNQRRLNRDLHPYYSKSDVERTTKYFIPVKHQSVAPSIDAELGSSYISSPKEELIPFFLNKAFKKRR